MLSLPSVRPHLQQMYDLPCYGCCCVFPFLPLPIFASVFEPRSAFHLASNLTGAILCSLSPQRRHNHCLVGIKGTTKAVTLAEMLVVLFFRYLETMHD